MLDDILNYTPPSDTEPVQPTPVTPFTPRTPQDVKSTDEFLRERATDLRMFYHERLKKTSPEFEKEMEQTTDLALKFSYRKWMHEQAYETNKRKDEQKQLPTFIFNFDLSAGGMTAELDVIQPPSDVTDVVAKDEMPLYKLSHADLANLNRDIDAL